jgi:hypothetical protein
MDELACFAPGMLALGASGYGPEKSEQIMNLAKEVIPLVILLFIKDFKSLLDACENEYAFLSCCWYDFFPFPFIS